MKILHVLDHSLPVRDGYAYRSHAILESQRDRGWDVVGVTSPKHGQSAAADAAMQTIGGITYYRSGPQAAAVRDGLPGYWEIVRHLRSRVAELVAREAPDILHVHSPALNAVPFAFEAFRPSIPVVYEMRALWEDAAVALGKHSTTSWKYKSSRFVETHICRRVDHIVVICNGLKQELVERGIAADRIGVVPNGVDLRALRPVPRDERLAAEWGTAGQRVVGFVGTFFPWEGLETLIEAFAILRGQRQDVRLLIVGAGETSAMLEEAVARLGLGDAVLMPGSIPHERVAAAYSIIDVLAYPRHSTRLTELVTPLKPLEGMAMRKAVVASAIGGHRELIDDGRTGVLFQAGDARALAAALSGVLDDRARRDQLEEHAFAWVQRSRDWMTTTQPYEQIYADLLSGRRRSPGVTGPATVGR